MSPTLSYTIDGAQIALGLFLFKKHPIWSGILIAGGSFGLMYGLYKENSTAAAGANS